MLVIIASQAETRNFSSCQSLWLHAPGVA